MTKRNEIQIIYLNGASSAGKTSIGKALQEALAEPYLLLGIDKIIGWMPPKVNNWSGGHSSLGFSWKGAIDPEGYPIQELQLGPYAEQVVSAFHEIVVSLAKKGFRLIIDDVAIRTEVIHWKKLLEGFSVLWVGVKAPLSVLEDRESKRDRIKGSARAQYYKVHAGVLYDIEVDTSKLSPTECADIIVEKGHLP